MNVYELANALGFAVPTMEDVASGRVTNPDQSEIVRARFYDFQLYPQAGVTQLSFFSLPIGQGNTTAVGATAATAKTKWDTNLQLGNQLPSGKVYVLQQIEVYFWPGSVSTANTYTQATPSFFNATPAKALTAQLDDVMSFYQSGIGELQVLDKIYVQETPIMCFPPQTGFSMDIGVATANTGEMGATTGKAIGRPYVFDIPFALLPAQNFSFNISYPSAVSLPSGFNGRVGVVFDGYLVRASQ